MGGGNYVTPLREFLHIFINLFERKVQEKVYERGFNGVLYL
jgi:hypothetical protein